MAATAAELLARSARLRLFVMLRRTVSPDRLHAALGDHLAWMIAREKDGAIVLSGPVAPGEGPQLDGLTILRAESLAAAEALAREDPFVRAGIVAFDMREWTVNEGALSLTVTLSDSTVTFA